MQRMSTLRFPILGTKSVSPQAFSCSFSNSAKTISVRHCHSPAKASSFCSSFTVPHFPLYQSRLKDNSLLHSKQHSRNLSDKMSFSNTDKEHADPYKEKSKDEPGVSQKIDDLVAFTKASKFGMMTTKNVDSGLLVSRCMAVAASENGGIDLIFHTNTESGKTDDLEKDGNINMSFVNGTGEWASISGKASIITDRSAVKKYYSPELKAWLGDLGDGKHDGSENDPRIGLIKIEAKTATYALSTGTMISRGYEIIKGAVTGDTAQVNKLREISEQEIQQYRSSH